MTATTIAAIRATPVTVPLEAPLLHSNGAHWGRFVRTIVEVETADGYVGLGEMGGGGEDATRAFAASMSYLRRPRRVRARGDALHDLQSDREPLQQPHAAARGDRVRVPRHHGPEARRAGACAARRQAARRGRVRELPLLPLCRIRRPASGEVRTPEQLVADAARAEGGARLHVAQAEGRRLSAGARARVLSRARGSRCPASASATTRTARCRSPTRSSSAAASSTSATTISRTRSGACRSLQRLKEFVPLPTATNTVVVNFEQLAANVAVRRRRRDPARHHVLGRHPAVHQGGRRLRDDGPRRRRAQLGRARHPARDDAALGAVVPNLGYAADAHYHHLTDDVIVGGRMRYENGAIRVPDAPGLGVDARPRQARALSRALPRAGRLSVRSRSRAARAGIRSCRTATGPIRRLAAPRLAEPSAPLTAASDQGERT